MTESDQKLSGLGNRFFSIQDQKVWGTSPTLCHVIERYHKRLIPCCQQWRIPGGMNNHITVAQAASML